MQSLNSFLRSLKALAAGLTLRLRCRLVLLSLNIQLLSFRIAARLLSRNREAERKELARPRTNLEWLADFSANCGTTWRGIYQLAHAASQPDKAATTRRAVRAAMTVALAISLLICFRLRARLWLLFLRWFSQSSLLHRWITPLGWKLFVAGIKSVVKFVSSPGRPSGKRS